MSLEYKVGQIAKLTDTEGLPLDQSVTGVGFQPKLLIITTGASNSNLASQMRPSFGWSAGPTENFMIGWGSDNNITTPNGYRRTSADYCVWAGGSNSSAPKIKLKSFDADGFTLTYETNDASTYDLHYIVVGGSDVQEVKAGLFTPNTTTGNQDVTDVGFQPSVVFFMGANAAIDHSDTSNSVPECVWFTGVANFDGNRNVLCGSSTRPGASNDTKTANYQRSNRCIAAFEPGGSTFAAIQLEADFVQTLENGFRINLLTTPAENPNPVIYLAVKGGTWGVGSFLQPISVGSQTINTGLENHIPKGILLRSANKLSNASASAHHRFSFGAASITLSGEGGGFDEDGFTDSGFVTSGLGGGVDTIDRWALWAGDKSEVNPTITARGRSLVRLLRLITEAQPAGDSTINADCDLTSVGTDGTFTINWTTVNDTTERQILYVTAGDTIGGEESFEDVVKTESMSITENAVVVLAEDVVKEKSESMRMTESAVVILSSQANIVTEQNLQWRYSGGANNIDPDLSLGGVMSEVIEGESIVSEADYDPNDYEAADYETEPTTEQAGGFTSSGFMEDDFMLSLIGAASGIVQNPGRVLDDVTEAEADIGDIINYRCIYVVNLHDTGTIYDLRMWISRPTEAGDLIQIGVGTSPVGGTEQTIADEEQAPEDVDFTTAEDSDEAITIAEEIGPGQHKAIWIKREVHEGTPAFQNNFYELQVRYFSDHL